MPRTDNQKAVTAYIPLELYNALYDFKSKEGLRSDSQAITTILERFFGSNGLGRDNSEYNHKDAKEERFERIEARLDELAHLHEGLKLIVFGIVASDVPDDVLDTVPSDVPNDVLDTVPSDVPNDVLDTVPSDVPDTVPSDVPSDVPDTVPSDVPSDFVDELSRKNQLLIICKVNRADLYHPLYWTGSQRKGFVNQLNLARTYDKSVVK